MGFTYVVNGYIDGMAALTELYKNVWAFCRDGDI